MLGDQGVGTDGAGVDLVGDKVAELEHVDDADDDLLVERLAGAAVEERRLAVLLDPFKPFLLASLHEILADTGLGNAVEDRCRNLESEGLGGDTQMGLENLADVHSARHSERVEHDVDGRTIGEEGHVLLRDDLGDDALVTVTSGHLVTDGELALAGDEDLDLLDDAGIDIISALDAAEVLLLLVLEIGEAVLKLSDDLADLVADRARVDLDHVVDAGQLAQEHLGDLAVGGDDDLA